MTSGEFICVSGSSWPFTSESENCQTVNSELQSHSSWLCGDLQTRANRRMNWMCPSNFIHVCVITFMVGVAGGYFHGNSASVEILRNPLVERTWSGSSLFLSCRGSKPGGLQFMGSWKNQIRLSDSTTKQHPGVFSPVITYKILLYNFLTKAGYVALFSLRLSGDSVRKWLAQEWMSGGARIQNPAFGPWVCALGTAPAGGSYGNRRRGPWRK